MMASACIKAAGMSPDNFMDCAASQPSQGCWLSPRISFSRDFADEGKKNGSEKPDLEDLADFEFRLNDPVAMLTADELFSDGKLVPLHMVPLRPATENRSEGSAAAFSLKAPRCSSRWKEMLGLKKAQGGAEAERQQMSHLLYSKSACNVKSRKCFLYRNSRSSSTDSTLGLPLLRDSDSESVSISARASLSSSSSSGADHEDLPRFSLDNDKISLTRSSLIRNSHRARVPSRAADGSIAMRIGPCSNRRATEREIESPRLNASGKVVFQGLGRSASSPSTFNGGPRPRLRGMERSYSANVRVTPVLNVPICNLRGTAKSGSGFSFVNLFCPHRREKEGSSSSSNKIGSSSSSSKTASRDLIR